MVEMQENREGSNQKEPEQAALHVEAAQLGPGGRKNHRPHCQCSPPESQTLGEPGWEGTSHYILFQLYNISHIYKIHLSLTQ